MRRACVKRGCGTSCLSISGLRFSLHASPRDPAVICLAPGCVSGGKCGAWCLSQFCIVGAPFPWVQMYQPTSLELLWPYLCQLCCQTCLHQPIPSNFFASNLYESKLSQLLSWSGAHLNVVYQLIVVTLVSMLQRALLKHSFLHGFASYKAA